MTFQASEYDVQTAPTWGIKPSSASSSPSKPVSRGSLPVERLLNSNNAIIDSPPPSPQKSLGSRSTSNNTKETEKQSTHAPQNTQKTTSQATKETPSSSNSPSKCE